MQTYIWIALGGAIGSVGRYWLAGLMVQRFGAAFPWGTLAVNVTGSLAIGFFMGMATPYGRWPASPQLRDFFMVGFCGGYTTFSSFSLQTLQLIQQGHWFQAAGNAVLSFVLCLAAVWAGLMLALLVNQKG